MKDVTKSSLCSATAIGVGKANGMLRGLTIALMVFVGSVAPLQGGDVLSVQGTRFLLDGKPFEMWGIRVVNALWDDQQTQELLVAMSQYRAYGINTIGVNLQGGSPGFEIDANGKWYSNSAFRSDGSLKPEYMERLRAILERARELDMVVNVGYFYQRQCRKAALTPNLTRDHWDSPAAIYRAVRNATEWLRPYRHVFLDIANEYGHGGYQYPEVFSTAKRPSERVPLAKALVDTVHAVDPQRLCGISPMSDEGIIDVPTADICYTHGHPQPHLSGNRPQVNNEQLNRGSNGVYTEDLKQQITSEAVFERENGNYWFWHSAWIQYYPFNFTLTGSGTEANPGDGWMLDFFASVSNKLSLVITQPTQNRFDLGQAIPYEGEAYDSEGQLITDASAYSWFYDRVGGSENVALGTGRSGTVTFSMPGTYQLRMRVNCAGQTKSKSLTLYAGTQAGHPLPLGVDGRFPAMAVDKYGRAHLVFLGPEGVYYMRFNLSSWSEPERIPGSGGAWARCHNSLDIAADSRGLPHVAWYDGSKVKYSARLGENWSQPVYVATAEKFAITTDTCDNLWVLYRGKYLGSEAPFYRMKTADATSFGDSVLVYYTVTDRTHAYCDIASGPGGDIHLLWRWDNMGEDYDPLYRLYRNGTWQGVENIDNSEGKIGEGLFIAVHPDGTPYVSYWDRAAWVAKRVGASNWQRQRVPGLEWSQVYGSHYPRIAIDGQGRIYVVSHQGDKTLFTDTDRVIYNVSDPTTGWGQAQLIDPAAPTGCGHPAVAAGQNCAHVVWMDKRGSLFHRILGEIPVIESRGYAPMPVIQATPTSGTMPLTVRFDATTSYDLDGRIVSYLWEFGDGDSSWSPVVTHTYLEDGGYEPRLYVTDDQGQTSMTFVYIQVAAIAGEGVVHSITPSTYLPAYVNVGDAYYADRDYRVTSIPQGYEGLLWIKTVNNDKTKSDLAVSFTAGDSVTVYVVHDARVPVPSWLTTGFVQTSDRLGVTDPGCSNFRIWSSRRTYAPGEAITLGPNGSTSGTGSMYVVMVRCTSKPPDLQPRATTVGGDLTLRWKEVPRAEAYYVYRGDSPYFEPQNPIASIRGTEWTDVGAASEEVDRFYVIKAKRPAGAKEAVCRIGKMRRRLSPGLNLVSLPLIPADSSLGEILGARLTGGSNATQADRVLKWTGSGYEVAWLAGGTGTPYDGKWFSQSGGSLSKMKLRTGEGFWVEIRPGHPLVDLTFLGEVCTDSVRVITLNPGYNLIGTCFPTVVDLRETGLRENGVVVGASNMRQADRIMAWNGKDYDIAWLVDRTGTQYDGLWLNEVGSAVADIKLEPGKGYWLHIRNSQGSKVWMFPNPAR
ncbi:MAG: PKD domain-containing protein [bacterium]|nr:PKD domain-containing protein [candidate division KSB1 bacterium]MDH7558862.1 PKD domain-containing protein [bacterium]